MFHWVRVLAGFKAAWPGWLRHGRRIGTAIAALALIGIVFPMHALNVAPTIAAASSPPRKVILFLGGVCTAMPSGIDPVVNGQDPATRLVDYADDKNATFHALQNLLRSQYGYQTADFMAYSYNGGFVDAGGIWHHAAYKVTDPQDTNFITTGYQNLHNQIVQYEQHNPSTSIVLVGHSLGGVVGFEELHQDPSVSKYVSKIITIDSPLRGITPEVASYSTGLSHLTLGIAPPACAITGTNTSGVGTVTTLLVNRYNSSSTQSQLITSVTSAQQQKMQVYNAGNTDDCLMAPSICTPPVFLPPLGDVTAQWLVGATQLKYTLLPSSCPPTVTVPFPPTGSNILHLAQQYAGALATCISETHTALLGNRDTSVSASLRGIGDAIGRQTSPAPTVTSVSPASGPTSGGTSVTITGTNFTGASDVKFGSTSTAPSTVDSTGTHIRTVSPGGSVGTVDVTVTTPGGTTSTSTTDKFTYLPSTPPGTITEFPIPTLSASGPEGITHGPDGNVWFTQGSAPNAGIGRITPSGNIAEFPTGYYSGPGGITQGPDGNLWFTEYGASKIGQITPSGTITEFSTITYNSEPIGITAGPDGNLWFVEWGANQVGRITPSGTVTEFPIPTANSDPGYIASGADGNLWFTEQLGNKIGRITPSGIITEFPIPTAASTSLGITAGPDGNIWFAEYSGNKIGRITPSGVITEFPVPTANIEPYGITQGPDGNLWFTEYGSAHMAGIGRITPSGTVTEFPIPTFGAEPVGITAGSDGNLWFTESAVNQIGRITP